MLLREIPVDSCRVPIANKFEGIPVMSRDEHRISSPTHSHNRRGPLMGNGGSVAVAPLLKFVPSSASAAEGSPNIDDPRGFEHRFADVNGIRLHYVEEGKGPLVILVHGFPFLWYCGGIKSARSPRQAIAC